MKPKLAFGCLIVAMLSWGGLGGSARALDVSSLSNTDASAGLKKALDQGINLAVGKLGVTDCCKLQIVIRKLAMDKTMLCVEGVFP